MGDLALDVDGSGNLLQVTFDPTLNENGLDTTTYEVCDSAPTPNCVPGTMNFDVAAVNDPTEITAPPTATTMRSGETVTLAEDYSYFDPDIGDIITLNLLDATATELPDGTITYTAGAAFVGTVEVPFELCDGSGGCWNHPSWSHWAITVIPSATPSVSNIPAQNYFVGVSVSAGPFPVDNPSAVALSYTDTLPPGLSVVPGVDEITITGIVTDPAFLGTSASYDITVTDAFLNSSTNSVFITFAATGLSPLEGEVIFTEILAEDMDWCLDGICVKAELVELYNRGAGPIDVSGWTVQTNTPGTLPDGGDLYLEIGPDSTPIRQSPYGRRQWRPQST